MASSSGKHSKDEIENGEETVEFRGTPCERPTSVVCVLSVVAAAPCDRKQRSTRVRITVAAGAERNKPPLSQDLRHRFSTSPTRNQLVRNCRRRETNPRPLSTQVIANKRVTTRKMEAAGIAPASRETSATALICAAYSARSSRVTSSLRVDCSDRCRTRFCRSRSASILRSSGEKGEITGTLITGPPTPGEVVSQPMRKTRPPAAKSVNSPKNFPLFFSLGSIRGCAKKIGEL